MHWGITNNRPEHTMFSALVSNFPVSQNPARMSHSAIHRIPFLEVMMTSPSSSTFAAFVGIDWADRKHDFCLQARDASKREFGTIEHSSQAIDQWVHSLHRRFGGPIAICLELAKGPLVSALQRYDFLVLFPVHPATLATYRQAFVPSRAKDDPTDAEIALDILLRHRLVNPCRHGCPRLLCNFELDGPASLLLHDYRTGQDMASLCDVFDM